MGRSKTIDTSAQEIRDPADRADIQDLAAWQRGYTEEGFWRKIRRQSRQAGALVIERALQLFYALKDPAMPPWAKLMVIGALGYFILPVDLLPDFLPGVGFADDLATLTSALMTVHSYITDEVRAKAHRKLRQWFPDLD
jgi:uncharacterized membrane protein YkvA (DUF1232 family)